MSIKNFYPSKQTVPFRSTRVEMGNIIQSIKSLNYPTEVKRSAYIIIRNETANGRSVINDTNVCGAQSDSGKWPSIWDDKIVGVCVKNENMTGRERGFLVFDSLNSGIEFLCDRIQAKGIFIGENIDGRYHKGDVRRPDQLADAYQDEWVHGEDHKTTSTEIEDFRSMYNQAKKLFP